MDWYTYEHRINSNKTLAEAADLKRRLEAVEGLRVADKGEGKLLLMIGEPESLNSAPAGSHEFARGFLLFSTMIAARHELHNMDVWWEECQVVSTDGPRLRPTGKFVQVTYNGHKTKQAEGE